jgi:hypothetical protein
MKHGSLNTQHDYEAIRIHCDPLQPVAVVVIIVVSNSHEAWRTYLLKVVLELDRQRAFQVLMVATLLALFSACSMMITAAASSSVS